MEQFEYIFRSRPPGLHIEDELNKLGSEGWELVCIIPGLHGADIPTEMIFKRRK